MSHPRRPRGSSMYWGRGKSEQARNNSGEDTPSDFTPPPLTALGRPRMIMTVKVVWIPGLN